MYLSEKSMTTRTLLILVSILFLISCAQMTPKQVEKLRLGMTVEESRRITTVSPQYTFSLETSQAEDMIKVWEQHAPNMNWNNVIGIDSNSPYDCLRMKNLAPTGNFSGLDRSLWQMNASRPTPELANHRTPIKNLYATGGCWHIGSNAGANESYNCYKIIATDLDLGKPWEEPGKEDPFALREIQRELIQRQRDEFPRTDGGHLPAP